MIESTVGDNAIHITLSGAIVALVVKEIREFMLRNNGNSVSAKLDKLIQIGEKHQQSLDELVVAARVETELRQQRIKGE